jgi:hypothetical protein
MNKNPISPNSVSSPFVAQHAGLITGVLHCWDRIRFLGTLRTLQSVHGMMGYLQRANVLLKDFRQYVSELTARVRQQSEQIAEAAGRPAHYLHSSLVRKDGLARQIAEKDGIEEGLIGLWSCVEPCRTFFVSRDPRRKILFLEFAPGKCLHHYFYFADPQFGLMHLRLQTWFPFGVSVCVNGHLWLARLMDQAGIAYRQQENCFTWIEDPEGAQRLASSQLQTDWAAALNRLLGQCHPLWEEICRPIAQQYYWSAQESEFSLDVLFASRRALERLYPRLIRHAIINFGSRDVLRFLGQSEKVRGTCQYEIKSSLKARPEGLRVKHTAAGNSVKIYDKQATVLRTETTISQTEVFRVYREPEPAAPADAPQNQGRWMRMRKGVADMHRRAEVSQAANERYLRALAVVPGGCSVGEAADTIFRPVSGNGRRHRALNPWADKDAALLEAIHSGQWTINGFRNRDLRLALYGKETDPASKRQQAARITRLLALLRAHGIIKKVSHTHRYHLTDRGRQIITALQVARKATIEELLKIAA